MKVTRADVVRRAVGVLTAVLDTRHVKIVPEMLNSAGSVSAEWYVETLWHYLWKRKMLQGVSSFDVEFKQPARLPDRQLHFSLPHPEANDLVMDFEVRRKAAGQKQAARVPVGHIVIHRGERRRRHGVAPDAPYHPYGIEVRRRHLNSAGDVSWYTLVAVIMDVARRGAQFLDPRIDRLDPHLLYIVPRFSFVPLADAKAEDNLFIYPEFAMDQPWAGGKTSAKARVVYWAVANDLPRPIAESVITVVRTSVVDGARKPVDENGEPAAKLGGR